jgi:hypothetical protein
MSKLMMILGVIFAAIGLALAVMIYSTPGQMQVLGLTPDTAAILLTGGVLAFGIGGVIGALDQVMTQSHEDHLQAHVHGSHVSAGSIGAAAGAAAAVTAAAAETMAEKATETVKEAATASKASVTDTILALERAKTDITVALGGDSPKAAESAPAKTEETAAEEEGEEDDTLYVVEEKTVRGRPARVLSDGTVEAETDEGWMRFENMEHLDEYLDATGDERA